MSIIAAKVQNGNFQKNSYFAVKISSLDTYVKLRMDLLIPYFDTSSFPRTYQILRKELPSILRSKCFNENNFSFAKEVKNTELGHLFEHIILENVCHLKRLMGEKNPVHNGITSWNWHKDQPGRFHIQLDILRKDQDLFLESVKKSTKLLIKILESSNELRMFNSVSIIDSLKDRV